VLAGRAGCEHSEKVFTMLEVAGTARPEETAPPAPVQRSVASSTVAVMAATLLSMVLGFAREVVNAKYFGERWELDAFLVAAIIPTLVFGVFNGALVSALVPIFSSYFAEGKDEEAWRLSSTVINALLIVLSLGALLGWFAAPWIVHVVARGFPAPEAGVTTRMTRILIPTIVATSIAGVLQALLNAQRSYRAASLQGAAVNLCTILGVVFLFRAYGIYALVFGTAAGLAAQLAVQLPNYVRRCRYRLVLDLHHPGLVTLGAILGPVLVGSAVGQVNLLFDKYFASTLDPGNIAAMQYATKVAGFPQQLFAAAIATVIFPILSGQFAKNELQALRTTASAGLRMTALITIPSALGLIALARPIISVLFERGEFTPGDVVRTAGALQFYAIGLLGIAASIVLTRCFFAMHDSKTPVIVAMAVVALNVLCSALSVGRFGINGLAASNSLASLVEAGLLAHILRRRIGLEAGGLAVPSLFGVGVASVAMAATAAATATALWRISAPFWEHCLVVAVAMGAGALVFALVGAGLRIPELGELWGHLARHVRPGTRPAV
jgi:putative peptidoglycan lipid II flippase